MVTCLPTVAAALASSSSDMNLTCRVAAAATPEPMSPEEDIDGEALEVVEEQETADEALDEPALEMSGGPAAEVAGVALLMRFDDDRRG